jgi:nucleoside-diphosphate-sugar epimerase
MEELSSQRADPVTRFLVTGATGFIGSAVVRHLLASGERVLALRGGREPTLEHPRLEWRQIDLLGSTEAELHAALAHAKLTHCIHAAWYTNHADYLVHEVNRRWVAASRRLANAFTGRLVALGTCLEYDVAHADNRCVEDETPLGPQTLYARSKVELFEALQRRGGDSGWARVFFVYGPGDREGRLLPNVLARFTRGESFEPTVGGVRRDYIHVDDLAGQITRVARSSVRGAINTGTGEAPTLSELVETAASVVGRPELAFLNQQTGNEPLIIAADLGRFRSQVGNPNARGIAQGIADLVRSQLHPQTPAR